MTDMLAKAKELNASRTKGKWNWDKHTTVDGVGEYYWIGEDRHKTLFTSGVYYDRSKDAEFIAFAPEFFDWAIQEIEELRAGRAIRNRNTQEYDPAEIIPFDKDFKW